MRRTRMTARRPRRVIKRVKKLARTFTQTSPVREVKEGSETVMLQEERRKVAATVCSASA